MVIITLIKWFRRLTQVIIVPLPASVFRTSNSGKISLLRSQKEKRMSCSPTWFVYIVRCSDNSLYTGVTTDLQRRVAEHNGKNKSARYTRVRQPIHLVYSETAANRADACKREARIKSLSRSAKLALISTSSNTL